MKSSVQLNGLIPVGSAVTGVRKAKPCPETHTSTLSRARPFGTWGKIIAMLIALSLAGGAFIQVSAEQRYAETRELTLQEAYDSLLEENKALQKAKEDVADEAARLRSQNSALVARIRTLETRAREMGELIDQTEKQVDREKEIAEEKISDMKAELQEVWQLVEEARQDRDEVAYIRRYNETKIELQNVKNSIRELSRERERELETAQKIITDITGENESLKGRIGKIHFNLATALFRNADYVKAAYEYEQALAMMPDDADTNYNLAIIYDHYLGDPGKANDHYAKYLQLEAQPRRKKQLKERMAENQLLTLMEKYKVE